MLHNYVYMFFQVHATTFFCIYLRFFQLQKNLQCYSIVFFLTDPDPDPNYIYYIWKSEPQKNTFF